MAASHTSVPLDGPINLMVRLGHGSLTVAACDDLTDATVHLAPRQSDSGAVERMTVEMQGATLVVSTPRPRGFASDFRDGRHDKRHALDVVIEVPTGTALKLSSGHAGITVTGRCGGADVTGAGDVSLSDVDGDLRLRYGSGQSQVGAVSGSVRIQVGSGAAHLGEIGGSLECAFGSGSLTVVAVHGDLRSRAGSGSVQVQVAYGNIDMASGSGTFTIGLPAGVSARVDVLTGSGQLRSDLPVENAPSRGREPVTIRARTGSGDVVLVRAPVTV